MFSGAFAAMFMQTMRQLLASGVDVSSDTGRKKSKRIGRCPRTVKVSDPIVIHSIDGLLTTLLLQH